MRRNRLQIGLAAVVVAAGAAYSGWWWYAARTAREEVEIWAARERANGSEIAYGALTVSGYPAWLRVRASDLRVRRPGGLTVQAPVIDVAARPWSVLDLTIDAPSPIAVVLPTEPPVTVDAARADGEVRIGIDGLLRTAHMRFPEVVARPDGAPSGAQVARLELDVTRGDDGSLRGGAHLTEVEVPAAERLPLGRKAALVNLRVRLPPPVPARLDAPTLAGWTQGGGRMLIERVEIAWGPLGVTGEGWMALDGALQPIAQVTGRISGYGEALDAFAAAGFLRDNIGMARTVLNLMAAANPNPGSRPEIVAGMTIQDRWVTIGPVRIGRVPPVAWPQ